jgi:hypothetical protein
MDSLAERLRGLDPAMDVTGPAPNWLADLSDAALVRAVAQAIARPKRYRSSSFIIHAPLELLARADLLSLAPPDARSAIRLRIAAIAAHYAEGEEIPGPTGRFDRVDHAYTALLSALSAGDADLADAAICDLSASLSMTDLARLLADDIAPLLGHAAHAPILLAALPQAERRYGDLRHLLRAPIRALALEAGARLHWVDQPFSPDPHAPATLVDALASPPSVSSPSVFIAPTMQAVEANDLASRLLGRACADLSVAEATRHLARSAALSMIQDDPTHAPYGWTHCLTLPQGVLALAPYVTNHARLVRIAATFALGFRATLGQVRLDATARMPAPHSLDLDDLVHRAASHYDAHVAKYVLACLTAATQDPEARDLYLSAANYLVRWWADNPDAGFDE